MKLLIIISMLASTVAFATETKTECPWMREMNKRNNPKAGLVTQASKTRIDIKSSNGTGQ
jgi:hypothetical protein